MSLLLTLEQGPRSQAVRQTRLEDGDLIIGRSPESDWQIDDPDMYVSRAHCTISARQDGYFVTDTSTSGLFINDSGSPLGHGNSTRLQSGMRMRLGDYVVAVDVESAAQNLQPDAMYPSVPPPPPMASRGPVSLDSDDFFSLKTEEEPKRPRPADLPNPFDQVKPATFQDFQPADANHRNSQAFDDPFSLDPVSSAGEERGSPNGRGSEGFSFDVSFSSDAAPTPQPDTNGFGSDWLAASENAPASDAPNKAEPRASLRGDPPTEEAQASAAPARAPWELPVEDDEPPPPKQSAPPAVAPAHRSAPAETSPPPPAKPSSRRVPQPQAAAPVDEAELRAAFLRGMGLDDAEFPGHDPVAEMEKFGREYRLMMEGLMQLLRKRAEEKVNARVAQTIVGASEVNPLKFLPTVDDALATILADRSPGFLAGDAAIKDAVRDLAHHHVRAWRGVQTALRRMIDRFDPVSIEEELKSGSAIGTLLSGGRGAKLWELYQKRHKEIAQSAENRFLGEVGADFRDAYEEE